MALAEIERAAEIFGHCRGRSVRGQHDIAIVIPADPAILRLVIVQSRINNVIQLRIAGKIFIHASYDQETISFLTPHAFLHIQPLPDRRVMAEKLTCHAFRDQHILAIFEAIGSPFQHLETEHVRDFRITGNERLFKTHFVLPLHNRKIVVAGIRAIQSRTLDQRRRCNHRINKRAAMDDQSFIVLHIHLDAVNTRNVYI